MTIIRTYITGQVFKLGQILMITQQKKMQKNHL